MSTAQFRTLAVLTVVSGFLGGATSNLLLTGGPAIAQVGEEVPEVIRAQRFEVVGDHGETRAALGQVADAGVVGLQLYDAAGNRRVTLNSADDHTSALALADGTGQLRVALSASDEHGANVGLFDAAGQGRVALVCEAPTGGPLLQLSDATGQARALLTSQGPDGSPSLQLNDSVGERRITLSLLSPDGSPYLGLRDAAGRPRTALSSVGPGGNPGLWLWDAAMKERILVSVSDGRPSVVVSDASGVARAVMGCTSMVNRETDATTQYPESTMTLFRAEGSVIWQAP